MAEYKENSKKIVGNQEYEPLPNPISVLIMKYESKIQHLRNTPEKDTRTTSLIEAYINIVNDLKKLEK